MHVTMNHGSQNAFLRHLSDNCMMHQTMDLPHYRFWVGSSTNTGLLSSPAKILPGRLLEKAIRKISLRYKLIEMRA